ncbi:MAG: hypothetical protein HYS52_00070 [Candidatus Wildermuthbacteria bacterium]|nr:hypothetical protein [Candidatus Wildermuthbacteria bacterium]
MVLGIDELHKLVKEQNLVTNLSERELTNPEGAGFDLRIGELYEVEGQGFLGVNERETPKMKLVAKYEEGKTTQVLIKPRIYYVLKTIEKVNIPHDISAFPQNPRSTLYRSGVYIFGGPVHPGYQGELSMGIYNFRDEDFRLEMGARVVHIVFFQVQGKGNAYRGQWQGGRVTTDQKETQV